MVIEDPSRRYQVVRSPFQQDFVLASAFDRAASVVLDFAILSPIVAFVGSPLSRLLRLSRLQGLDYSSVYYLSLYLILTVVLGVLYQWIFVSSWGATPGKLFLKLKVVSIWELKPVDSYMALTRAFGWWLNSLFLGIPHLGIFSDLRRRGCHDRMADTMVIKIKNVNRTIHPCEGIPDPFERRLAHGIYGVLAATASTFILISAFYLFSYTQTMDWLVELAEFEGKVCSSVSSAAKNTSGDQTDRLELALALYLAQLIQPDCLDREAQFALWSSPPNGLAYLAAGLVLQDSDQDQADEYFKKVCELSPISTSCGILQALEMDHLGHWPQEGRKLNDLISSRNSVIPALLGIEYYYRIRNYPKALALVEKISPSPAFAKYLQAMRIKITYLQKPNQENLVGLKSFLETQSKESVIQLSSWLCGHRQKHLACYTEEKMACQIVEQLAFSKDNSHFLNTGESEVALIHAHECLSGNKPNYAHLGKYLFSKSSSSLAYALSNAHKNPQTVKKKLLNLFKQTNIEAPVKMEVLNRFLSFPLTQDDLEDILELWGQVAPLDLWHKMGLAIFEAAVVRHFFEAAKIVGQQLLELTPNDPQLVSDFKIALRKSKSTPQDGTSMAVNKNRKLGSDKKQLRSPASTQGDLN